MRRTTHFPRSIRRLLGAALPALLAAGCSLQGNQSTFDAAGPVARRQLELFRTTWHLTAGIFLVVGLVLAYATIRYRSRNTADAHAAPPPQRHGNPLIEGALILASIACLAVIAVPTLRAIRYTYDVPANERADALQVTATGNQWWFKFEYPGINAATGAGGEMPLLTANELVIPAGRAIRVNLRTADVMHSFWVPKLAGKVDMVPNRGNHLWLKADEPGYYFGQCAEFCGESHAVMRFRVIALPPEEFAAWVARQTRPAVDATAAPENPTVQRAGLGSGLAGAAGTTYGRFDGDLLGHWRRRQGAGAADDPALVARGRALFTAKTCAGCHTIRGHEAQGITAPDLTHFAARITIAAGLVDNTAENLRVWLARPAAVKPGNKMAQGFIDNHVVLEAGEIDALVAYLDSLH